MDRNSALFEKDKDLLESLWDNAFSVFDWQHILLDIILVILLTCCCLTLWFLFRHYLLKHRKSRSLRNSLFYSLVFSCLTGGILVYFTHAIRLPRRESLAMTYSIASDFSTKK